MGLVALETIETDEEKEEVYRYIKQHVDFTDSSVGKSMLENWNKRVGMFVKVFPHDCKRVLMERVKAAEDAAAA